MVDDRRRRRAAASDADEPQAHLATRIPQPVYHRMKVHCVEREVAIRDFVVAAVDEKLAREGRRGRKTKG